jgi:hypothetical protein
MTERMKHKAVKSKFLWPNMKREIEEYVKKCKSCQIKKMLGHKNRAPVDIMSTADQLSEKCCIDIVGPLSKTETGNSFIPITSAS